MKTRMTLLLTALLLFCGVQQVNADSLRYITAYTLTLVGKAMPGGSHWHRIDTAQYSALPPKVKNLFRTPAGLAVCFTTDSKTIAARWELKKKKYNNNFSPIAQKGLDLYRLNESGAWQWTGVARPSMSNLKENKAVVAQNMPGKATTYLLYLPLYTELVSLEIGIDSAATIQAAPDPFRHKVVIYGSSILHGVGCSRPGIAFASQMSRRTGINFINLGLSGRGKMEGSVADMLAEIDADAFVLDCMPNPTGDEINERAEYMVRTIRKAHPKAPIIMIESYRWENNYTDSVARAAGDDRARAFVSQAERLIQAGIPYLYLIRDHNAIGNDHEGSADGIHPNDLGFARIIAAYEPELLRILRENGIE